MGDSILAYVPLITAPIVSGLFILGFLNFTIGQKEWERQID